MSEFNVAKGEVRIFFPISNIFYYTKCLIELNKILFSLVIYTRLPLYILGYLDSKFLFLMNIRYDLPKLIYVSSVLNVKVTFRFPKKYKRITLQNIRTI